MPADLVNALLTSPVLVALSPAVLALIGGKYLLQAKDERITSLKEAHEGALKAKDERIAALELLIPANLKAHLDGMVAFYETRSEQLHKDLESKQKELDENRDLSDRQREELQAQLRALEARLT